MESTLLQSLVKRGPRTKIVFVVLDGLGGLPDRDSGLTELEAARTPALDGLASRASLGLHVPIAPGITPGSGPAHLALFGYDPVTHVIGRGALSALGIGFDLRPGDVAARLNLASLDSSGAITDRRAGRPSDEEGRRVIDLLKRQLSPPSGIELHLQHEKEHRALLVLRGQDLDPRIQETDPQTVGVAPLPPTALDPAAEKTSEIVSSLLDQTRAALAGEEDIHMVLARGWAGYVRYPSFDERYGLRAAAYAKYPMYRGVAIQCGMSVNGVPADDAATVDLLVRDYGDYDFHFVHFKDPDSRGHDGDFQGKVRAIEAIDALIPRIVALEPDVLVVTGDHATPSLLREHSWHGVPLLIRSAWARGGGTEFGENACRTGELGVVKGTDILPLALAHAGRLEKFGA